MEITLSTLQKLAGKKVPIVGIPLSRRLTDMAIIFTTHDDETGRRSIRMYDTNAGAKVGKWCRADSGLYPDRCYCILENLQNGVATDFAIEYGRIDGKRVAYRQGCCAKCAPEYA